MGDFIRFMIFNNYSVFRALLRFFFADAEILPIFKVAKFQPDYFCYFNQIFENLPHFLEILQTERFQQFFVIQTVVG